MVSGTQIAEYYILHCLRLLLLIYSAASQKLHKNPKEGCAGEQRQLEPGFTVPKYF